MSRYQRGSVGARLVLGVGLLWACALVACAGPRVLPPRSAPSAAMPRLELPPEPPAPGFGRLVIDATDGPMDVAAQNVERFTGASTAAVRAGTLCRTPCAVDLPYGRYKLFFSGLEQDPTRGDVAEVEVQPGLTVLRRAPGKYETPEYLPAGPIALAAGGAVLTTIGAVMLVDEDQRATGGVLAVGGLGLMIAAIVTMPHRAEQQAGASTVFHGELAGIDALPVPESAPPSPPTVPAPPPPATSSPATPGVDPTSPKETPP